MFRKIIKFVIYTVLIALIGIICYFFVGITFFGYNDKTLTTGCEKEFCIGQSKDEVSNLIQQNFTSDYDRVWIRSDPDWSEPEHFEDPPVDFTNKDENDYWGLERNEKWGWSPYVHLKFENNVLKEIKIVNYGPFFMDF